MYGIRNITQMNSIFYLFEVCGDLCKVVDRRPALACKPVIKYSPRNVGFLRKFVLARARFFQYLSQQLAERLYIFVLFILARVVVQPEQKVCRAVEKPDQRNKSVVIGRALAAYIRRQFRAARIHCGGKLRLVQFALVHQLFQVFRQFRQINHKTDPFLQSIIL